ncbi:uncharacterized protein [Watersipora subatra]|uniref:uncharacterized protein n=1 Tax=Watersipora subatra TaxID=2589382 RepID=UPI00355B867A
MIYFNFALFLAFITLAAFPVTQGMTIAQNVTDSEATSNVTVTSAPITEDTTPTSTATVVGSCSAWGSTYTPDVASDCTSYIQSAPGIPDTKLHCPEGLKFDISTCACNFASVVSCPP